MAANSKREQIILADLALVRSVSGIKTPIRKQPQHSVLMEFAQTQFPVCAVVGRLPIPDEKHSGRQPAVDQLRSTLKVDVFTYLQVNEDIDSQISDLADSLFAILYTDQTRGKLCYETTIKIVENTNIWDPFAAFQLTAIHKYVHSIGGI
ncbi:MAG: hypothetical protein PF503_06250 [Desulfobacula sp.]|jgi:hypothetical protein|nr:hypothetical protein [Desulfobacula sp.]